MRRLRKVHARLISKTVEFFAVICHDDTKCAPLEHSCVVSGVTGDEYVLRSEPPLPEDVPHRQAAPATDWNYVEVHSQRHNNFSTQPRLAEGLLDRNGVRAHASIDFIADLELGLVDFRLKGQSWNLVQGLVDLVRLPSVANRVPPTPVGSQVLSLVQLCADVRVYQIGARQAQFLDQGHGVIQPPASCNTKADTLVAANHVGKLRQ